MLEDLGHFKIQSTATHVKSLGKIMLTILFESCVVGKNTA